MRSSAVYPPVFNLAQRAAIKTNATCGESGKEEYCRMNSVNQQRLQRTQCEICDANSPDPDKRHLISYALEATNRWWQSPNLLNNKNYEKISIDLDLGQVNDFCIPN